MSLILWNSAHFDLICLISESRLELLQRSLGHCFVFLRGQAKGTRTGARVEMGHKVGSSGVKCAHWLGLSGSELGVSIYSPWIGEPRSYYCQEYFNHVMRHEKTIVTHTGVSTDFAFEYSTRPDVATPNSSCLWGALEEAERVGWTAEKDTTCLDLSGPQRLSAALGGREVFLKPSEGGFNEVERHCSVQQILIDIGYHPINIGMKVEILW